MVGIGAALALRNRGLSVTLVDRRDPGEETSFGNAGIIQGEASEPYPMPRSPNELWKIARRTGNDVHWDLGGAARSLLTLARYWHHSAPSRHQRISSVYARLIERATRDHDMLIAPSNAERLIRRTGFRELHRDMRSFENAQVHATRMKRCFGRQVEIEDVVSLRRAVPALKGNVAGALWWQDAWSCKDPAGLVQTYADLLRQRGGTIRRDEIEGLEALPVGQGWRVLRVGDRPIEARHVVVALGAWSPTFLRPLGYRIAMVRKRGYHRHYHQPEIGLDQPLVDAKNGVVLAPMNAGLRLLTGADLSARPSLDDPLQIRRGEASARELVDFGEAIEKKPWTGVRPCMPDMLPVVGQAPRHPGLWFDFGHGHQGFTLGPTTGELLAEALVNGNDEPLEGLLPAGRIV